MLSSFNMTPQRMRMIVEAFKESLEQGLAKNGQIVVSIVVLLQGRMTVRSVARRVAHDPDIRLRLAVREGDRDVPRSGSW